MAASPSTINQLMVSPKHGVSVATINLTGLAGGNTITEHHLDDRKRSFLKAGRGETLESSHVRSGS